MELENVPIQEEHYIPALANFVGFILSFNLCADVLNLEIPPYGEDSPGKLFIFGKITIQEQGIESSMNTFGIRFSIGFFLPVTMGVQTDQMWSFTL